MHQRTTDVVILGSGTAGMNARREVERAGRSWLLVDPGPLGTTCARVGCMPSKLLIAAADAAWHARHAATFGVETRVQVDGAAVLARVRRERDRFTGFVLEDLDRLPDDRRVAGRGRLVGPTTVEIDGRLRVEARAIVIATGSRPTLPPGIEAVSDRLLLSDDVFELPDLPPSVAVIGAGVIGLELGQALHRLGVGVTVLDRGAAVLGIEDPAVAARANEVLAAELDLQLGVAITRFERIPEGVRLHWAAPDGAARTGTFAYVLAATGRRPNVAGLGLEALGVPLDGRGVPLYDPCTTQVADLPVFLAGDVSGHRPVLHEASDEGRIAGANAAAWPDIARGHRRTPMEVAFTDPQLAVVGAGWSTLRPEEVVVGEIDFRGQGRARVAGRNEGLGRIYVDRITAELVGATLFAPAAEHLGHLLAWAVCDRLPLDRALDRPFYHPVLEEGLRTALRDAAGKLRMLPRIAPEAFSTRPGQ